MRGVLSARLLWIPVLALVVAGAAALDERTGIQAWRRLRDDLAAANARIEILQRDVEGLRAEGAQLESDSFALERAIREDLGLARPGERVVRLDPRRAGPGGLRADAPAR